MEPVITDWRVLKYRDTLKETDDIEVINLYLVDFELCG